MKNLAVLLTPLLLAAAPACDASEPAPDELRAEPGDAEDLDDPDDPDVAHHGPGHHGPHRAAAALDHLCGVVDCTDEQRGELAALMPEHRRGDRDKAEHKVKRKALHKKLADAFRGDTLDTAALADVEAAMTARHTKKRAKWTAAAVQAHGILTPAQRETAATTLEALAPMLEGKPGKHGAKRIERTTDRLCEAVTCEGNQHEQIEAALTDAMPRPDSDEIAAIKAKALAAVRADTIDAATVDAIIADVEALKRSHKPKIEAMLSEVHAILTAEQRAIVADTLETRGPRALIGGRGHRGRHGHRGRRGDGPGPHAG